MTTENYEFYRASSVGEALMEALNDLIITHQISGDLAIKILHNFDRIIPEVLETEVKATTIIRGKIKHYKQVDDVWTFAMKNVRFMTRENGQKRDEVRELTVENITILTCPAKKHAG